MRHAVVGTAVPPIAALLVVLSFGAYANTLRNGFVLDDDRAVIQNRCVAISPGPACAFTHDFWGRPGSEVGRTYRPLVVLTFALDWALGGGRPWVFHLTNVLCHAAASVLLFFLLLTLTQGSVLPAAVAGALFAVMAVHTEAVAGVVGRADVLAVLFSLAALTLHVRDAAEKPIGVLGAMLLLFALALLSHELAILVPGLALVCDGVFRPGSWPRRRWVSYAAMGGVTVLYLLLRVAVLGGLTGPPPDELNNPAVHATLFGRWLLGLSLVERSIVTLVFPLHLSAEYGQTEIVVPASVFDGRVLAGIVLVAALAAGLVLARRRWPAVAAGCGLVLLPLLLTSSVIFLMPAAFAERWLYWPSVGMAFIACGMIQGAAGGRWLVAVLLLCGVLGGGNLVRGLYRNQDWRDGLALFESATRACPSSVRAQLNLGLTLNRRGRHAEALVPLGRALHLQPKLDVARLELAIAYALSGHSDRAVPLFEVAYRRAPLDPRVIHNYATFLFRQRSDARAEQVLEQYLRSRPRDVDALRLLRKARAGDTGGHGPW